MYYAGMEYKSKGYVFDIEVTAWLEGLKAQHGSYNKGLRQVAFPGRTMQDAGRIVQDTPSYVVPPSLNDDERIVDKRPKNCFCKHCGNRFAGPKFATICPECKSECPQCTSGASI